MGFLEFTLFTHIWDLLFGRRKCPLPCPLLLPANEVCEGYVFTPVILLTGGCASVHAGIADPPSQQTPEDQNPPSPSWEQTPPGPVPKTRTEPLPGSRLPSLGGPDPPQEQILPTPPCAVHAGRAGGTHPTGMHTCICQMSQVLKIPVIPKNKRNVGFEPANL